MKAIQTLWCGGRSLLRSPFWWRDAEYNLMSWALSCHSLREQFGGVTLYTDSEGARVLVDALGLPYTEVVVNYDGFDCLTCHWALAKVRTYSLQTGPFVHIDGDIYMPRPLPAGLRSAGLLAQNVEVYTDYNRSMVRKLLAVEGLQLAPRFREVLEGGDVPSLNLGFCGGTDLGFFGRFCGEVFRFFSDNDFNGERFRHDDISANVVFEQIFFAIMARDEGREVAAVYPGSVGDNRYTAADFCDLLHYPAHGFFHVLGGHKRTRDVCDSVARALLWRHPATFARVAALFPGSLPGGAAQAEARREAAAGIDFLNCGDAGRAAFVIARSPLAAIDADIRMASAPYTLGADRRKTPLTTLDLNILSLLGGQPVPFGTLVRSLRRCFGADVGDSAARLCVARRVEALVAGGVATALTAHPSAAPGEAARSAMFAC